MKYVQITREELEEWLESLKWKWSRVPTTAGIYHIHLSDNVAVKLSSTIGTRDDAMGRGQASMNLELVSRITGHVLNRKARDRKLFQRTQNWRKTWKDGVEHWEGVYQKSAGFYDAVAEIKDRERYKRETLEKIESVVGWGSDNALTDFYNRVQQDGVLTKNQMGLLDRMVARNTSRQTPTADPPSAPAARDEGLYQRTRQLYQEAQRSGDTWLLGFLRNVGPKVRDGAPLSPGQTRSLNDNLQKYRLASLVRRYVFRR